MRQLDVLENLSRINRYSGNPIIKEESVSDHVWSMVTLAIEFVPKMNKTCGTSWNLKDILYGINLHDIDESLYTDIPRPFKHHNARIKQAIKDTADRIMIDKLGRDFWMELKSIEDMSKPLGYLIKVFDILQAGYKMKSEIELGNKFFRSEINNIFNALEDLFNEIPNDFELNTKESIQWLISECSKDLHV